MPYKACVIGDSKLGGYGHGFDVAFTGLEDVVIVAVADPDEAGRKAVGEKIGAKNLYADYREMLKKEMPDLVAIGPRTPIHHKEYLLAAAEVGAHGYLEKPVCVDLREADEMVAAVEEKNLKWAVGFQISMSPVFLHAKKQVHEGLIGEVLEVRARGKEDRRSGGEDLIVLGIHLFDALYSLFGEPKTCDARFYDDGTPSAPKDVREANEPLGPIIGNRVMAHYTFDEALPVSFQSFNHKEDHDSRFGLDIYGSKGIVKIRMGFPPTVLFKETSSWVDVDGGSWSPLPDCPEDPVDSTPASRNRNVVEDLLAAIEEDRLPEVSLQRARWAQEMIQGAFASHAAGRRLSLPLDRREHPLKDWK